MLSIEYPEPELTGTCPRGGKIYAVTRLIARHSTAYGVCHASLTEKDPAKQLVLILSLGEWWIDDTAFRRCFSVSHNVSGQTPGFAIVDPEPERWKDMPHLGRMLSREQALADPEIDVLWEILHRLFTEDPVIVPYLKKPVSG
jgi:hypothetical protein